MSGYVFSVITPFGTTVYAADNGEGPPDKDAKEKAKKLLDDPKHKRPKGSPEDEKTRDDELPPGD